MALPLRAAWLNNSTGDESPWTSAHMVSLLAAVDRVGCEDWKQVRLHLVAAPRTTGTAGVPHFRLEWGVWSDKELQSHLLTGLRQRCSAVLPCGVCAVCFQEGDFPDDPLIQCQSGRCGLSVHRQCYRVPRDASPIGWRCDGCKNGLYIAPDVEDRRPVCYVCKTNLLAAVKPVVLATSQQVIEQKEFPWAHVCCLLWSPDCGFKDPDRMDHGWRMECISASRRAHPCLVCGKNDGGATLRCQAFCVDDRDYCSKTVHVVCAGRAGLRLAMKPYSNGSRVAKVVFCPVHTHLFAAWAENPTPYPHEHRDKDDDYAVRRQPLPLAPPGPAPKEEVNSNDLVSGTLVLPVGHTAAMDTRTDSNDKDNTSLPMDTRTVVYGPELPPPPSTPSALNHEEKQHKTASPPLPPPLPRSLRPPERRAEDPKSTAPASPRRPAVRSRSRSGRRRRGDYSRSRSRSRVLAKDVRDRSPPPRPRRGRSRSRSRLARKHSRSRSRSRSRDRRRKEMLDMWDGKQPHFVPSALRARHLPRGMRTFYLGNVPTSMLQNTDRLSEAIDKLIQAQDKINPQNATKQPRTKVAVRIDVVPHTGVAFVHFATEDDADRFRREVVAEIENKKGSGFFELDGQRVVVNVRQ